MKAAVLLSLFLVPASICVADTQGSIYGVDTATSSITVAADTKLTTYRMRPSAEITINGIKAKLSELNDGMTVKVVSAEPSIASKVIASGVPKLTPQSSPALVASVKQIEELGNKLKDSKWEMKGGKTFVFHADGTTTGSWHQRKGTWKVVAPNTIDMYISWAPGDPDRATVSPDGYSLRWENESAVRLKR